MQVPEEKHKKSVGVNGRQSFMYKFTTLHFFKGFYQYPSQVSEEFPKGSVQIHRRSLSVNSYPRPF